GIRSRDRWIHEDGHERAERVHPQTPEFRRADTVCERRRRPVHHRVGRNGVAGGGASAAGGGVSIRRQWYERSCGGGAGSTCVGCGRVVGWFGGDVLGGVG